MLVFWGEGKPEQPEKTSRCRVENQQTQPTYDAGSGNRTRATLVVVFSPLRHPYTPYTANCVRHAPYFRHFFSKVSRLPVTLVCLFFLQSEGQCSLVGVSRPTKRLRSRSRRDSTLDNGKPTCSYCFPCGKLFPFCTYHLLPRRSTSEEPTGTQGKWYSFDISFFTSEERSCLVLETTSLDHGDHEISENFGSRYITLDQRFFMPFDLISMSNFDVMLSVHTSA